MKLPEFEKGMAVVYTPSKEVGIISSVTDNYLFVKFSEQGGSYSATARGCLRRDIVKYSTMIKEGKI